MRKKIGFVNYLEPEFEIPIKDEKIMNEIVKKKFKCKMCKHVYPITVNMLKDKKFKDGYGDKRCVKVFYCPVCGLSYEWNNECFIKWQHYEHELFDI